MRQLATQWAHRVRRFLTAPILEVVESVRLPDYRPLLDEGRSLPPLADVGIKTYSQVDEDGILLFLFAVLESGSKRFPTVQDLPWVEV